MKMAKQLAMSTAMLALLYFGLAGVAGAYNVFVTYVILMMLASCVVYDKDTRRSIRAKYTTDGVVVRPMTNVVSLAANSAAAISLLWVGNFVVAAMVIVTIINIESLLLPDDVTVDSAGQM
jgi:hypothetical protein